MPNGFPRSIFDYWGDGGIKVIESAVPLMAHYKRRDRAFAIFDRLFDPATFDREKPWFVQLWGEVQPGAGGDQTEMGATMMGEPMVELLAYVGSTLEGYPLVMSESQFKREYEID
jgi:hypothetical protein